MRRARVILMLASGDSYSAIEAALPCYRDYVNRRRRRFLTKRLAGLDFVDWCRDSSTRAQRLRSRIATDQALAEDFLVATAVASLNAGRQEATERAGSRGCCWILVSVALFAYAGVMYATAVVRGKVIRFKLSAALARAHRQNRGKTMTEGEAVAFVENKRRARALRRARPYLASRP